MAALVWPITTPPKFRLAGERFGWAAVVPVPLSATIWMPAPSEITTVPVSVPLAIGVNVTAIVQVLEEFTTEDAEQVVPAASSAKSPLIERLVIVKLLVPVLVSVTDCAPLVWPTTVEPNVSEEGVSDTPGAVPVPLKAIVCVPALSLIVTVPLRVPVVVGVNVTAITQVLEELTAEDAEQVELESSAKSPLTERLVMVSELVPVLVSVTDCAPLV